MLEKYNNKRLHLREKPLYFILFYFISTCLSYNCSISSIVRPVHLAMVSYGMPLFLKFLAINDFSSALPSVLACSMAYSHWFILSRSEFIFLMYVCLSLLFMAAIWAASKRRSQICCWNSCGCFPRL